MRTPKPTMSQLKLARDLRMRLGWIPADQDYFNFCGLQERWWTAEDGRWYWITPDGTVSRHEGGPGSCRAKPIARLSRWFWKRIFQLYRAREADAVMRDLDAMGPLAVDAQGEFDPSEEPSNPRFYAWEVLWLIQNEGIPHSDGDGNKQVGPIYTAATNFMNRSMEQFQGAERVDHFPAPWIKESNGAPFWVGTGWYNTQQKQIIKDKLSNEPDLTGIKYTVLNRLTKEQVEDEGGAVDPNDDPLAGENAEERLRAAGFIPLSEYQP